MNRNSTFLPVALALAIFLMVAIVVASGRSNAPEVAGHPDYAHRICTFQRYCAGSDCNSDPKYIISYTEYADGEPRLEFDGMNPTATVENTGDLLIFSSTGGALEGSLTIMRSRHLDFIATEMVDGSVVEHFATGRCDRLVSP